MEILNQIFEHVNVSFSEISEFNKSKININLKNTKAYKI